VHWTGGDLAKLLLVTEQHRELAQRRGLIEAECWAHYYRGCALYQLNDLAGAEAAFSAVVSQRYLAHGLAFSQAAFGLVSVYLAHGQVDRARTLVDSVSAYASEMDHRRIAVDVEAFRAYLAAEEGLLDDAWADAAPLDVDGQRAPLNTFVDPRVLRVRALLALRTPASLARAALILDQVQQIAAAFQNTRYLIECFALQALLDAARGDRAAALAALGQAIDRAESRGMVRVFADLGPDMARLLGQLAAQGGTRAFLGRALAAFGVPDGLPARIVSDLTERRAAAVRPAAPVAAQPARRYDLPPELIEPLSERELDVLALLAKRYSNNEIARDLSIAPSTVKRHTVNIYEKLQVRGRRHAVSRALHLGILVAGGDAPPS
jgi:LuxR family maltose regulon positive regulatory protein